MREDFIVSLLAAAITMGTPLLYAALGEVICERSGVINLGVEGMMLIGACTGFIAGNSFGSPWAGVAAAVIGKITQKEKIIIQNGTSKPLEQPKSDALYQAKF